MLCLEKEIEIVYDMAQRMLQYETVLVEASDICGELDRYLSLGWIYEPILTSEQSPCLNTGSQLLQAEPTTDGIRECYQNQRRPVRTLRFFTFSWFLHMLVTYCKS